MRRSTRRGAVALAALLLAALSAAPRRAAAQVSVDQAELFLDPSARGPRVASFDVTNEGGTPAQVAVYLADWERREDGEQSFPPSGTLARSCGKYLQIFPLSLRLPPGARQAVRLALSGADSLTRACWSIAFVETSAPTAGGGGRQITYVTRLGVKIYVVPPGLTKEGAVEAMSLQRGDSGGKRIAITFHATGGMPLWARGTLEYRRADNSVAATDSIPEFPVLPDGRRRISIPVHHLAAGKYLALALLDYGGTEIAAGQLPIDVP